jgi:hypothetical protein
MEQAPIDRALQARRKDHQHVRPADPDYKAHIPADHHYDNIPEDAKWQGAIKGRQALKSLYDVHEKILDTAKKVTNKADLAKAVEPAITKAIKRGKEDLAAIERHIEHQRQELKKAKGTGLGQFAQEVRGHMKGLKKAERIAFVREAVDAGDVETLKAIFGIGAHYLSGLEREEFLTLETLAEPVLAPDVCAERNAANASWARHARAVEYFEHTMLGNLKRWRGGDEQRIADLMKSLTKED